MKKRLVTMCVLVGLCVGCRSGNKENLVYLQLVDRNGYVKTVDDKKELQNYQKSSANRISSHQKIVKQYDFDKRGCVLLYHDNGVLAERIQTKDSRAFGEYVKYSKDGVILVKSTVMEGTGDLTDKAKKTWVFDQKSDVYDEEGNVVCEILYKNGRREGTTTHYYSDGEVQRTIPFVNGKVHGEEKAFDKDQKIIQSFMYTDGVLDGKAFSKGNKSTGDFSEEYREGKIIDGQYYDIQGNLIAKIEGGEGERPFYEHGHLVSKKQYQHGQVCGLVTIFAKNGTVASTYEERDGLKNGEEVIFYYHQKGMQSVKRLLISWKDGVIHGKVISWYPNGALESEKEMCDHKKEGSQMCWYLDSSLMMVEQYQNDRVVSGKYYRKGDSVPISRVIDGSGKAHIYDKDGILLRKVSYYNGNIIE